MPELAGVGRDNAFLNLIARWKWVFFALAAVLLALSFNGQWRVGRDSAAYRGLGHQLATTGRYVFRDKQGGTPVYSEQQDTRYPGLPLVLAGVEKAFGRHAAPAIVVIVLMAVATVALSYLLVRRGFPLWLAVCVGFGVGVNGRFLEHANEILSDVPFLLGVVASLLMFDRLLVARDGRSRAVAIALLVVALIFAAAMRPTFWVFALALVGTCLIGLVRPIRAGAPTADEPQRRRLACGLTLGLLGLAAVAFLLVVDVRGKGAAGYEGKLVGRFSDLQDRVIAQLPENVHDLLEETLPESFFGTQFGPGFIPVGGGRAIGLSTLFSLALIACGVMLVRYNLLWGLFVLVTIGTMAVLGSVPRYFIMILPLMLLGWGLHVAMLGDRFRRGGARAAQGVIVFLGLGVVVAPNLIACANLIREQRGFGWPDEAAVSLAATTAPTKSKAKPPGKGPFDLKHVGFMHAYHSGKWAGVDDVARMVRDNVRPGQKIFGPEATVLTFLSDREVFGLSLFLPRRDRDGKWLRLLRQNKERFACGIFPDPAGVPPSRPAASGNLYDDKDVVTGRLIKIGMLRPTKTIASAGGYKLCEYEVVPVAKKRRTSTKDPIAATQPRRGRPATTTTTVSAATPQDTAAAAARARRRRRAAARAATQPAAQPATRPATLPSGARPTTPGASISNRADGLCVIDGRGEVVGWITLQEPSGPSLRCGTGLGAAGA
jgi:hypothetical protein